MSTANDLITASFTKVGVDSPSAAQLASALISLNNLMSLLGIELHNVVVREMFSVESGDPEYTMGLAGQWDTDRPIQITSAFLRDDANHDSPLDVIAARDFRDIYDKSVGMGQPTAIYFVPEYPLAKIFFNMLPVSDIDIHLESRKNFTEFSSLSASLTLPPEYKEAIVYNLAVSLGEDWDRVVSKTVIFKAEQSKEIIAQLNASTRPPAEARFDGLVPIFGGWNARLVYPMGGGGSDDGLIDGGAF